MPNVPQKWGLLSRSSRKCRKILLLWELPASVLSSQGFSPQDLAPWLQTKAVRISPGDLNEKRPDHHQSRLQSSPKCTATRMAIYAVQVVPTPIWPSKAVIIPVEVGSPSAPSLRGIELKPREGKASSRKFFQISCLQTFPDTIGRIWQISTAWSEWAMADYAGNWKHVTRMDIQRDQSLYGSCFHPSNTSCKSFIWLHCCQGFLGHGLVHGGLRYTSQFWCAPLQKSEECWLIVSMAALQGVD